MREISCDQCSFEHEYHDPLCPTRAQREPATRPTTFDDPPTDSAGRIFTPAEDIAATVATVLRHNATRWTAVKDSGKREEFEGGSRRDTQDGKPRYDLIPPGPLERLAFHYANGSDKYGDHNWALGQPTSRILASGFRHLMALFFRKTDEDHAAALAWCALAFMQFEGTDWDDRFDWTVPPRPTAD